MGTKTTADYDAIVIGAGHNGLIAALTLAGKGRSVLVLERSPSIGGLCAMHEFAPGYRVPGLLPETGGLRTELIRRLRLESHGLSLRQQQPAVLAEHANGSYLLHPGDPALPADGLPEGEAEAYAGWRAFVESISPFVRRILDAPPPRFEVPAASLANVATLGGLAATGWALRRLGRRSMTETMRVLPMCAADWMRERFRSEALAAALAAPALLGSYNGPWAAGSAASLIFRECTLGRPVSGGPAALINALETACRAAGVEIRTDAPAERLVVEGERIGGVRIGTARQASTVIGAPLVLATCNPKTTMLDLLGPRYLDQTTERDLRNYRCRGTTAVLLLAVEGGVDVAGAGGMPIERLRLGAASFDDLERAFDAVKYGEVSERPYLEVWIPTLETPGLAPTGCNVVAALISCAPYDLKGGWSTPSRETLTQAAVHKLNQLIPGLRDRLAGGQLLAPPDLESRFSLPGGHLLHGEPALDQLLFLRPSLHLSHYSTPIGGLFLGGSGNHPGGGITGMPGRLAAQAALAS